MRVKRPELLTLYFRPRQECDLRALLRGEARLITRSEPVTITLLDGKEHALTRSELAALARLPLDWIALADIEPVAERTLVAGLADRGVLLSDAADAGATLLRQRAAELDATCWDRHAAVYHYTSRWQGRCYETPCANTPDPVQQETDDLATPFDQAVADFGAPPGPFRERVEERAFIDLPRPQASGPVFEVLSDRCTTRLYEPDASLSLDDFNTILHTVWGAQGHARLSSDMVVLQKTSPSAGALHPVEVYPLVRRVEGLAPGIYHYDVAYHGLELVRTMDAGAMADFIERITAGQSYFATAQVVFVLTARFQRSFWKYRQHSKAYRAVLFDAAHLSQTLYLMAAERGLGAFITSAFNEVDVDDALELDPYREGAIAVCGCGIKLQRGDDFALVTERYEPGTTVIR